MNVCPDCDRTGCCAVLGKCSKCYGTGVNLQLNSDEPKCRNCGGTGRCPTCGALVDYRGGGNEPPWKSANGLVSLECQLCTVTASINRNLAGNSPSATMV